jgi:hypothetical protein
MAVRGVGSSGPATAHPERFAVERSRKRDVALTVASLVPAALFWHGLGRLVPLTDRVRPQRAGFGTAARHTWFLERSTAERDVAFLAFRAIHKHRDPSRCQRMVWAASLASAIVNFNYEYTYTHDNLIAGLYLAVLPVFGMVIFHEFLAQFEEGAAYMRRNKRPPWGLRWFTSPYSTAVVGYLPDASNRPPQHRQVDAGRTGSKVTPRALLRQPPAPSAVTVLGSEAASIEPGQYGAEGHYRRGTQSSGPGGWCF